MLALLTVIPLMAQGEALPLDCAITINKDSVNLGEPVTATWQITGGTPPYTIASHGFISEGSYYGAQGESAGNTVTWTPQVNDYGQAYYYMTVMDQSGTTKRFESRRFEVIDPLALSVAMNPVPGEVLFYESLTISWELTGGEGPFDVHVYSAGNYGEYAIAQDAKSLTLSKYPYYRIDWQNRISLSISDAKGRMVFFETPSFKVIDDKPLQVEIQHRAGSVQPGQTISADFSINGGKAPYETTVYLDGSFNGEYSTLYPVVEGNTASAVMGMQHIGGRWRFRVNVEDSQGRGGNYYAEDYFAVVDDNPLTVRITMPAEVKAGQAATGQLSFSGGSEPYRILSSKTYLSRSSISMNEDGKTFTYTPSGNDGGWTDTITVQAADKDGRMAYAQAEVKVLYPNFTASVTLSRYKARYGDPVTAEWTINGIVPDKVELHLGDMHEEVTGKSSLTFPMPGGINTNPPSGLRLWIEKDDQSYSFYSDPVTLLLSDVPDLSLTLTADKLTSRVGDTVRLTTAPSGGVSPYRFEGEAYADYGEASGGYTIPIKQTGENLLVFIPPHAFTWRVNVQVWDSEGRKASDSMDLEVLPTSAQQGIQCEITMDKGCAQAGDTVKATWEITGGKAPYTVKGNWGYEPLEAVSGTSASTTVVNNRWYFYNLEVTDATGYTVNARTNPDPVFIDQSRINIAFSPDQPKFGDTITATVSIPGVDVTDAVYNYTWALDGIEQHRVTRSPAASDSYQPDKSGTLSLRVYVSLKSNGFEGQNAVVVLSPAEPLVVNGDYDKTTVAINTPITANWTIAGGAAPYTVEPIWFVSRDNEYYDWVGGLPGDNSSSLTPKDGLRGYLELRVKDTQGQEKRITFPSFRIIGAEQITPMQVDIKLDKSSVASGDIITANWTITGGAPPYVVEEAYWEVSDGWEYVIITEDEREGTASLRVPQGTRGLFHLTIRDYLGGWYYRSNVFRVLAPFPGDANLDGRLDIQDVASIANYLVGGARPASPANADADGQNGITLADLIWLINKLTGA